VRIRAGWANSASQCKEVVETTRMRVGMMVRRSGKRVRFAVTQSPAAPPQVSATASAAPGKPRFRPELQGLRALACLLVVVYHVWLDRVSGGVDVFFFVTGFLITGQLYRASARGRIKFRPTWGRIIKRLLPA